MLQMRCDVSYCRLRCPHNNRNVSHRRLLKKPTHALHTHHARPDASLANLARRGDAPQSQTMHWSGIKSLSFISCGAGCPRKHMSNTRTGHTGPASKVLSLISCIRMYGYAGMCAVYAHVSV